MAAIQLAFTLRTSSNVKTVHLVGNWDGYKGQLPLSKDGSKSGSWRGNFRFQQATLNPGKRYWYYYIMDGYHVSHDPAKPATKEPTTGRQLNILDVPSVSGTSSTTAKKTLPSQTKSRSSGGIPTGRGISPSRIISPKPTKAYASKGIREADYSVSPVDELSSTLSNTHLISANDIDYPSSPSSISSASSLSSLSDSSSSSSCSCNRFGITRRGDKVKLDCGGSRCGYSDDSSSCSSSEDESEDERYTSSRGRSSATSKPKARVEPVRSSRQATTVSRRR